MVATSESIQLALFSQRHRIEPANVDLLRRYVPTLAVHTHEQVARHVHPDKHGCWPWDGYVSESGYGIVSSEGAWDEVRSLRVHRYMYDALVGPIPVGHAVHHRCEHKACWHPLHLEALTPKEHRARHS